MKIEKINENQIKCTLTRSDLASRQLKLSELAYGTEKAKGLFQDMMEQASMEFGFDASDIPLMIEAIPVSMDCIILMITKVENPDEIDTRLSTFSSFKDLFTPGESEDDFAGTDSGESQDNPFINFEELAEKLRQGHAASTDRLYSFGDLDTVIRLAHHIHNRYSGENTLYKSPENGRYYLHMSADTDNEHDFALIMNTISEFGTKEKVSAARTAYMNEHFEIILKDTAVQSLAYV